jgi:DNA-binding PadR family transcriptional regulator
MKRKRRASAQAEALLATLLQRRRSWSYGYELSKATGLQSGTLYPLLIRLCDDGLLEDSWQESADPGAPPRHMYRLTPVGVEFARNLGSTRLARAAQPRLRGATT